MLEFVLVLVPWLSAWAAWAIADEKGRRPWAYALLGFVLPLIGLLITALMPTRRRGVDYLGDWQRARGMRP